MCGCFKLIQPEGKFLIWVWMITAARAAEVGGSSFESHLGKSKTPCLKN
jgi:hypothetical protein